MGVINGIRNLGVKEIPRKIASSIKRLSGFKTLGITYGVGLIADQGSKHLIDSFLPVHPKISASSVNPQDLPTIVNLQHYTLMSILHSLELLGFAVLPFFLMYAAAKKLNLKNDRIYQFGLGLLGGGTFGNFINHLIHNYTTDFLHIPFTYYYTNSADIMTFLGLPIFLWRTIANRGKG